MERDSLRRFRRRQGGQGSEVGREEEEEGGDKPKQWLGAMAEGRRFAPFLILLRHFNLKTPLFALLSVGEPFAYLEKACAPRSAGRDSE